jgi:2-iminoacetate synthase
MSSRLSKFEELLKPCSSEQLEVLAQRSRALTLQHFGSTMRLFAPLYLSNECVNVCKYCGFSRDNPILRATLTVDQVEAETRHLMAEGFRNILLVAGEHPKFVANDYLADCTRRLLSLGLPSINLEVGPMETEEYCPIVAAGAEGLVVYQETYNREVYAQMHSSGPKKDYDWRLACPDRAYAAGFRRIGIGVLLGLADWREEAVALAIHLDQLLKRCWKAFFTISFPRLRPAAGEFKPLTEISDRDYAQLICAFRLTFPQVGIVLSTRETPDLRDGLAQIGVTMMSAGSHTEPGGYTGVGKEDIHLTTRGKRENISPELISDNQLATEQFAIADDRSVGAITDRIRTLGYEPVWKDWDPHLAPK